MSQQQKSYLLPIVMMFALFAMISFVTGLPAPFGVIVQSEFGATNLEATLGFAANFIAYAFYGYSFGTSFTENRIQENSIDCYCSRIHWCRYSGIGL